MSDAPNPYEVPEIVWIGKRDSSVPVPGSETLTPVSLLAAVPLTPPSTVCCALPLLWIRWPDAGTGDGALSGFGTLPAKAVAEIRSAVPMNAEYFLNILDLAPLSSVVFEPRPAVGNSNYCLDAGCAVDILTIRVPRYGIRASLAGDIFREIFIVEQRSWRRGKRNRACCWIAPIVRICPRDGMYSARDRLRCVGDTRSI